MEKDGKGQVFPFERPKRKRQKSRLVWATHLAVAGVALTVASLVIGEIAFVLGLASIMASVLFALNLFGR